MTEKEILQAVHDLLAQPGVWTQCAAARDINDWEVAAADPKACKFCIIGAISRLAPNDDVARETRFKLMETLDRRKSPFYAVSIYNDAKDRTLEEVLSLIKETMERM